MARQYPVGGLAGLTRGSEDRAIILAQHGQPRRQIIGVAHGRDDAEGGAKEGAAHFSDQFLAGIVFAAKGIEQFTVEPRDMAAGMTKFVKRRPVVIDLLEEGGLRRDLDRKSTRLNS